MIVVVVVLSIKDWNLDISISAIHSGVVIM